MIFSKDGSFVLSEEVSDNEKQRLMLNAEKEDVDTIQKLAVLCFEKKEYKEGIKWLNVGRRLDDVFCITHLAYCYYVGLGVGENKERAIDFYLKAATEGDSDSEVVIAAYYFDVLKDIDNYIFWIQKALKAQNKYAIMYHCKVLEDFERKIACEKQELAELIEERERLIRIEEYKKIKERLAVSRKDIFAIVYEKKLQNKVHFWRANRVW